jgi:PAS domain-containing protein
MIAEGANSCGQMAMNKPTRKKPSKAKGKPEKTKKSAIPGVNPAASQHVDPVLIFIDIDSAKRTEEALRESEARFAQLANSAPVLIWISGADGLEYANKAVTDFFGVSEDEIKRASISSPQRARRSTLPNICAARQISR